MHSGFPALRQHCAHEHRGRSRRGRGAAAARRARCRERSRADRRDVAAGAERAAAARSCSATSASPTPTSRRWGRASGPTRCRCPPNSLPTSGGCSRCRRCGPGARPRATSMTSLPRMNRIERVRRVDAGSTQEREWRTQGPPFFSPRRALSKERGLSGVLAAACHKGHRAQTCEHQRVRFGFRDRVGDSRGLESMICPVLKAMVLRNCRSGRGDLDHCVWPLSLVARAAEQRACRSDPTGAVDSDRVALGRASPTGS